MVNIFRASPFVSSSLGPGTQETLGKGAEEEEALEGGVLESRVLVK